MAEDTVGRGAPIVNMENVAEVLAGLAKLLPVLQEIAERFRDGELDVPRARRPNRGELKSRAIVLAATLPNPNLNAIARELGVPRSTLRGWRELAVALEQRRGPVRGVRRGIRLRDENGDCDVDGLDD